MSRLRLDPAPARASAATPSAETPSAEPPNPQRPTTQPHRSGSLDGRELADRARQGDRRALARLLTEIEARSTAGEAGLRALYPRAGAAHLVGVTGAPGAGKSTLVAALVGEARRQGRAVAVVAIDPSSPITGGALLGDRVRMQAHAGDRDVFIRSMASRGQAGGLAPAAADAAAVLDAVGFPLVFIETVGSGQSEVAIASAADTTVVVEAPEMGDEVQAIKAGLLEVADVVVVSKGDRPGAQRAAAQLRAMLTVGAQHDRAAAAAGRRRPKRPEVLLVTAPEGTGVPELLAALDRRQAARATADGPAEARLARARTQLEGILAERLRARLQEPGASADAAAAVAAIAAHEIDPYAAADALLDALSQGRKEDR
ncbi:MAG TPA: methylmalonyl Co-A mutase-associated GTPase MeaB [Candidatus Limnocylindrales bacterium]|nr:methylmalonyl Co-A mutase-associated GTPase MeaB [Candidatus Limnocylindrales bacterium]